MPAVTPTEPKSLPVVADASGTPRPVEQVGNAVHSFEGGGFGVGSDVDLGGTFRVDVKPIPHFGVTAGYSVIYLKLTDEVIGRTVTVKPTLNGPVFGIGLYF